MENLSRVFRKKNTHEEIEFHNSIKIEFLLLFTGCRKVIGKMPALFSCKPLFKKAFIEDWS